MGVAAEVNKRLLRKEEVLNYFPEYLSAEEYPTLKRMGLWGVSADVYRKLPGQGIFKINEMEAELRFCI